MENFQEVIFMGTKKGQVRKTARRAYVSPPSTSMKKGKLTKLIDGSVYKSLGFMKGFQRIK